MTRPVNERHRLNYLRVIFGGRDAVSLEEWETTCGALAALVVEEIEDGLHTPATRRLPRNVSGHDFRVAVALAESQDAATLVALLRAAERSRECPDTDHLRRRIMSHCLAWWGPWEAIPEDVGNDLEEWARARVKRFAAALGRAA